MQTWVEYEIIFTNFWISFCPKSICILWLQTESVYFQQALCNIWFTWFQYQGLRKIWRACKHCKFEINSCQGFNKSDANKIEHMEVSVKLILKWGTKETRNALSTKRTKELIQQFFNEANIGTLPIRYTCIPIWTLLKTIYLKTEHLAKAVNSESYYKGYLNFDCPLLTINNYVVQKFQLIGSTTLPAYQCVIAPTGRCHQDNDCNYRAGG